MADPRTQPPEASRGLGIWACGNPKGQRSWGAEGTQLTCALSSQPPSLPLPLRPEPEAHQYQVRGDPGKSVGDGPPSAHSPAPHDARGEPPPLLGLESPPL